MFIYLCHNKVQQNNSFIPKYWGHKFVSNFVIAAELRYFAIYLSPLLLYGLLPDAFYKHWIHFVEPTRILSGQRVSKAQRAQARAGYNLFDAKFESLYGLVHRNLHIHLCSHLPDQCMY